MAMSPNQSKPTQENPRSKTSSGPQHPRRIEDYALIGDCHTAALVSLDGSIDWLCWPRFDSPACFAALLGSADNGRWRVAPRGPISRIARRYRDNTLILETVFETDQGTAALIDFMPPEKNTIVRIVEGRMGTVPMELDLALRFEYGSAIPWVTRLDHGSGLCAVAGPDQVVLHSDTHLHGRALTTVSEFAVSAGERVCFALTHAPSHLPRPQPPDPLRALDETETGWTSWTGRCTYTGPWEAEVKRSLITLKALTYAPTGGIVAAPTTSLPEKIGGQRNWDYRYCWVRDATFTLLALMHAGYREEAQAWAAWLRRSVAGTPAQVQTLYGIAGERWLMEWEVPWLRGYEGSAPVRIGNAASAQLQLDVFGELMDALYQATTMGLARPSASWPFERAWAEHLEKLWQQPDESIWEVRGGAKNFTFSKVMAWVAMDRAIRSAERFGHSAPLERWRNVRDTIHRSVCEHGFNQEKNSFVQYYGGQAVDAALLLLPLVGFLPADDPRIKGTIAAVGRELMEDGLVLRYRTHETQDGLPPGEGVFLACSFWYVDNLVLQGRHQEAEEMFKRLLSLCNDVGLLAEEYDPAGRCHLGNFPQAFSHLALIHSAMNLANHQQGPAYRRRQRNGHSEGTNSG
jgi:GH15 family glucan-1,4-alpha-glucosidase